MIKIAQKNHKLMKRACLSYLTVFFTALIYVCGCSSEPAALYQTETVQIKGALFVLELALTPEERAEGLMGREKIAAEGGMLFVFPNQPPYPTELGFWMKNCLTPIDLIFLDPGGQVIAIHEMNPPLPGVTDAELPVYQSGVPAQFAIELQGGRAAEIGVAIGDVIDLRVTELLKTAR